MSSSTHADRSKRPHPMWTLSTLLLVPGTAFGADADFMRSLHEVFVCLCAALVLFMQPGFAFLESGMARAKNAINVIMKNIADVAFGSIAFWLVGYGLMFGINETGWIGLSGFAPGLGDFDASDLLYQTMFAATAATIVSGAVAERIRYVPYLIGAAGVTVIIYPLFGAWAWGGTGDALGWLNALGFHDAAGGTVVHVVGGFAALGALVVLGPRIGRFSRKGEMREIPGHNLPMFALGGFILWFGWFGFNGGAVKDDFSDLGLILVNTNLAAAAGVGGAILTMLARRTPVLMTTAVNGALGGLVAITAACNVVEPWGAVVIGLVAGSIVALTVTFLHGARIDDVVGAVPVHGFCGAWGTLAVGIFHMDGLFNVDLIITQGIGVFVAILWAFCVSFGIFKLIDVVVGLRATSVEEQRGLDYAEHFEIGYSDFAMIQTHANKGA